VLIPIGGLQRAVVEALRYAETLSTTVRAIYVDVNPGTRAAAEDWDTWGGRVKLVVLPSPFRSLMERCSSTSSMVAAANTSDYVTVILPDSCRRAGGSISCTTRRRCSSRARSSSGRTSS